MRVPDYPSVDIERWSAVDAYFADLFAPSDDGLRAALFAVPALVVCVAAW